MRAQARPLVFLLNMRARRWLRAVVDTDAAGRTLATTDDGSAAVAAQERLRDGSGSWSNETSSESGSDGIEVAGSIVGGWAAGGGGRGGAAAAATEPEFHVKEARRATGSRCKMDNMCMLALHPLPKFQVKCTQAAVSGGRQAAAGWVLYFPACLPASLPACLPCCLPACLAACLPARLPACTSGVCDLYRFWIDRLSDPGHPVIFPDFPLDLTGFFPGKHLFQF